jgi:alcohol dehydrogenase, propanol-preferring
MCRTDVQLLDGYFRSYTEPAFPLTLGHEIAGEIDKIGGAVPKSVGFEEGDQVVGRRRMGRRNLPSCHEGNTQICSHGKWPGVSSLWRLRRIPRSPSSISSRSTSANNLKAEELAPLTDAGLTPYRGIKKLRDEGALGPDRVLAVFGIGGLGSYAIQYAKLLGGGATVVAFGRNEEKLPAKDYGADHVINIKGR